MARTRSATACPCTRAAGTVIAYMPKAFVRTDTASSMMTTLASSITAPTSDRTLPVITAFCACALAVGNASSAPSKPSRLTKTRLCFFIVVISLAVEGATGYSDRSTSTKHLQQSTKSSQKIKNDPPSPTARIRLNGGAYSDDTPRVTNQGGGLE